MNLSEAHMCLKYRALSQQKTKICQRSIALFIITHNYHSDFKLMLNRLYLQLNDPKLLRQTAYVDGKWVSAESGAKFSVIGICHFRVRVRVRDERMPLLVEDVLSRSGYGTGNWQGARDECGRHKNGSYPRKRSI